MTTEVHSAAASEGPTVVNFKSQREVTAAMEIATGEHDQQTPSSKKNISTLVFFWMDILVGVKMYHLSQAPRQAECVFRHLPLPGVFCLKLYLACLYLAVFCVFVFVCKWRACICLYLPCICLSQDQITGCFDHSDCADNLRCTNLFCGEPHYFR